MTTYNIYVILTNMKTFQQLQNQLLKNKQTKRAYGQLQPEYELVKKIISKRLEKGLTQQQLANKIGTKQSAISRLESGNYNPSLVFLQKIATGLDSKLQISLN